MESPPEPADPPLELALALAHAAGARPWLEAALSLDHRLAALARRPGDPALTRVRLLWWEEAVSALGGDERPVDPVLLALEPLVFERPDRTERVVEVIRAWDEQTGQAAADPRPLSLARGRLLADGAEEAVRALAGRTLAEDDPTLGRTWLTEGLRDRWPRSLAGQRLLARAALHRLEGGGERSLALRLPWWALTGR